MKLMEKTLFTVLLGKISEAQSSFRAMTQEAAVIAIGYSIVHRDVRPGQQLLDTMGKTSRKDAMLKFLEVHGNFAWMAGDKTFAFFENKDVIDFNDEQAVAKLQATSWDEAKKAAPLKSMYDVDDMFTKFMVSTRATIRKAQAAGIKVKNLDMLDTVASLVADIDNRRENERARIARLSPEAIELAESFMAWDEAIEENLARDEAVAQAAHTLAQQQADNELIARIKLAA